MMPNVPYQFLSDRLKKDVDKVENIEIIDSMTDEEKENYINEIMSSEDEVAKNE